MVADYLRTTQMPVCLNMGLFATPSDPQGVCVTVWLERELATEGDTNNNT